MYRGPSRQQTETEIQTLQVRIYGEPTYNEVIIDWSQTRFDGLNVFAQLGNICEIPANRSTRLYVWKHMTANYDISMLAFDRDVLNHDPGLAAHSRTVIMDMLNSGHNNFVLAAFLRVASDNRLSVCYSLVHEDLVRNECTTHFCLHAHTRLLIRHKKRLIVNERLNTMLAQELRGRPIEERNRVYTRLNIGQFLHMTCEVALRERENIRNQDPIYDRQRG